MKPTPAHIAEKARFWIGAESHNIYAKKIKLFYKTRVLDVSPLSTRMFDAVHADSVDAKQKPRIVRCSSRITWGDDASKEKS